MARRGGKSRGRAVDRSWGRASLGVAALALAMALVCLALIGPPPVIRQDDLWVHANRGTVRFLFGSIAVACGASVLVMLAGRRRALLAALWIAGIASAVALFSDRIPVIGDVVFRHWFG